MLTYLTAICTVISMFASAAVWLTLSAFKRGQREADFVTRAELQQAEDRIAATYARNDLTNQRINQIEDRINELRQDLKEGISQILTKIDRLGGDK